MGSRILAVDPIRRGFAYAVIETPAHLIDWGLARSETEDGVIRRFEALLDRTLPDVVVMEDFETWSKGTLRTKAKVFLEAVRLVAFLEGLELRRFSSAVVRGTLGAKTKQEIAELVALRFPELSTRLPRKRKPWESEAARMNLFDAASLALVYLEGEQTMSL